MFRPNDADYYQGSLFDPLDYLSKAAKKELENSWARVFHEKIFPSIDEAPYAVLYSQADSRPNTPVNILIGSLILKEFLGLSDDEFRRSLMFDIRLQYALHITNRPGVPLSDRSLSRFRERCMAYEKETGIDLLKNTFESVAAQMAEMMGLDLSMRRMDSLLIASNIKRMSRLELLYTCVANLVCEVMKQEKRLPESLVHYTEKDDHNRVIYHAKSEQTASKIDTVLKDAKTLRDFCGGRYDDSENYQLLMRALSEQAVEDEEGNYHLKASGDKSMTGSILQNPADPEATYREKAGKQHRGYVGNVVEAAGDNGGIVTNYQYEQNTYSDCQFTQDVIDELGPQQQETVIVSDGAFYSEENQKKAQENNINLFPTNLTGRSADEFLLGFEIGDDNRIHKCPAGHEPKSSNFNNKSGQCGASFYKEQCDSCPYREQCHPTEHATTYRKTFTVTSRDRAEMQQQRDTAEFKENSAFRNGIESIPSTLRRRFHIDSMPSRGYAWTKIAFGCKITALNLSKFVQYVRGTARDATRSCPDGGDVNACTQGMMAFDVQSDSGGYCALNPGIA